MQAGEETNGRYVLTFSTYKEMYKRSILEELPGVMQEKNWDEEVITSHKRRGGV